MTLVREREKKKKDVADRRRIEKPSKEKSHKKTDATKKLLTEPAAVGALQKSADAEIDELFERRARKTTMEPVERLVKEKDPMSDVRGLKKGKRSLTDDGLPIFSWQEMRMGRGGDTRDCPFDCQCCF